MNTSSAQIETLGEQLDCSFEIWQLTSLDEHGEPPLAEWQKVAGMTHAASSFDNEQRQSLLSRALEAQACEVQPLEGGLHAIALPASLERPIRVVALGVATLDPAQLCEVLANNWQARESDRISLAERQRRVDLFALQMSHKLGEISWLRRLSERLEVSNSTNRIENVANDTFAELGKVVRADSLVLVKRLHQLPATRNTRLSIETPVWIGPAFDDPERLQAFLKLITGVAGNNTFAWTMSDEAMQIPLHAVPSEIQSCLLVKVRTSLHDYGWILAINRKDESVESQRHEKLTVHSTKRLGFGTVEASLLEAAAGMLATHAANIELFEQQHELTVSVIRSLINIVDARDSYTCGHSDRVALMARALAECFGLDREVQEQVYLSGLLHDIGKVAIPDDVLLKSDRLTTAEYEVIKEHPQCGVNILKHIKPLAPVLPGVLYHHEAVDGSGYPHGLRGEDIPLMGRIIAIVDAYDAMTTNRPYRTARTQGEAVATLLEGAGSQWDARLVNCFLENFDKISEQAHHWQSHIARLLADGAHECFKYKSSDMLHEASSLRTYTSWLES